MSSPENTPVPSPDRSRLAAAWISFGASLGLLALKSYSYEVTGSSAVLSDALESIVNVLTAAVALFVIRFAAQPADREHPYGHGKAEYFSASFEGGLIFFAAMVIFLESLRAFFHGVSLRELDYGFLLMLIAALLNLLLGIYLKRTGRRQNSEALSASGAHVLSDVKTTVGVALGLLLVKITGYTWLDPLAAMIVALFLAWEGYRIVRRSVGGLMDERDFGLLETLAAAMWKHRRPGVIEIHQLRILRSGNFHHVDGHMVVPEYWDVSQAHELTERFERAVAAEYPHDIEFAFHTDPCRQRYCQVCDMPDCPIRLAAFKFLQPFTVPRLIGEANF
ncbi:MAG: cation transporter [Bdellovibrionaceae bacterium]|nr:cation transporter [Pseudobdellovibrionaceae bacterium]MBX3032668.1 cation transporter [Pseudobdellovibrionaceae bacterium]